MFRWALLFVLACPALLSGQMVRGTATDATTGAPIKAVNLSLYTSEGQRLLRGVSDEAGTFELVLPKGKTVYLQADRIGYETVRSQNITASTSELLELNVRLSAAAIPLQGIEVTARRQVDPRLQPFLDRASLYKRSGMGHIWTRKEIERRHPAMVSHIINRWVPPRYPFNCDPRPAVFIDDWPVEAEDIDLLVGPDQLEGVELYNDLTVPPDLLMRAARSVSSAGMATADVVPPCRTVMLWRKPYGELPPLPPRAPVWRVLVGAALLGAMIFAGYSL